ncbi:MAG TPA: UDP-N-acetylmuramate dehydrogenase [Candidatus Ligilactobacillus excrementigallinarum]|uniref:UDP-N-acetylenolpyruvoylglucosamine reductase n=1 Tax=Candidatus Ligilactobacillus excrementigallinarum TaxID=2838641 RepID=A0A9D1UVV2_9LACO|nr:UDP-N-acetylmuramate dehydrogenase [Candidatus Ligilactobacillus excrementigallinarum]
MNFEKVKVKKELAGIEVYFNEPLSNYTNTCTGGPADLLVLPTSVAEVKQVINWVNQKQIPLTVLGNSSNLIVKDGGIRGVVMILTNLNRIQILKNQIIAESGALLIDVAQIAGEESLTGMEPLSGIPGSVGGAVFMNAGAYGGEISQVVKSVLAVSREGELRTYRGNELRFGYRHSRFQDEDEIVLQAVFELQTGQQAEIFNRMREYSFLRASKQPLEYPSCGSVFKRPAGHYTGKLIHDAGLQGFQIGGAQVSKKHAGFIVNVDHATATDYQEVIQYIQRVIKDKFDVQLETEVRIIGEEKE